MLLTLLILTVFRTHVAYEPSRNWRSSKQVSAVAQWIERPFSGLNLVRDLFCFVPRSWLDELLIHHFTATKHLIYHDLVNLISASLIKSKWSIFPLYFSSMLFSFFSQTYREDKESRAWKSRIVLHQSQPLFTMCFKCSLPNVLDGEIIIRFVALVEVFVSFVV